MKHKIVFIFLIICRTWEFKTFLIRQAPYILQSKDHGSWYSDDASDSASANMGFAWLSWNIPALAQERYFFYQLCIIALGEQNHVRASAH